MVLPTGLGPARCISAAASHEEEQEQVREGEDAWCLGIDVFEARWTNNTSSFARHEHHSNNLRVKLAREEQEFKGFNDKPTLGRRSMMWPGFVITLRHGLQDVAIRLLLRRGGLSSILLVSLFLAALPVNLAVPYVLCHLLACPATRIIDHVGLTSSGRSG